MRETSFELAQLDPCGGGNWHVTDAEGNVICTGTYRVTHFISSREAPGNFPQPSLDAGLVDNVGRLHDARASVIAVAIEYSRGAWRDLSDLGAPKMTGEVPSSTAWAYADAISTISQRQRVMKSPRCSASGMC